MSSVTLDAPVRRSLGEPWRTLGWSAWLGWQIESNWADVRLFFLYLVVKPVCASLMLVCMFYAVQYAAETAGSAMSVRAAYLPFIYVSSACYGLVNTVMFGMSTVVINDRESYRMLKYIYISPARFQVYFVGRGLARGVEGFAGAVITIATGLLIPDIRDTVGAQSIDWAWLAVYLAIGSVLLWSCGMLLASAMLNMSRSGMFLSEGIAGVVYFLSGVVFPISVLPRWAQYIGLSLPTTYWLEGMRRALTGPAAKGSPFAESPLAFRSNGELAVILAATTVVLAGLSQWFYRYNLAKAWRTGRLEETTGV